MSLERGTQGRVSGGLRDRPNSVSGNLPNGVHVIRSIDHQRMSLAVVLTTGRRFEATIWLILVVIDLWTYVGPPSSQQPLKAVFPAAGAGNFHSLVLFLLLYFARVTLIYVTFTRATKTSATIWAKAAFNLLLYMLGGHVFGGLWYSFAIGKVIECWKKACKKYPSKCSGYAFGCYGTLRDSNFLNEFCPAKTQNRTIYDFGIYRDALESGIVETTNLTKKILYCFRWGLQNLRYSMGNHLCSSSVQFTEVQSFLQRLSVQSAFGQSLQASTDKWENIFVISITIYSMVLFVFFIGNVQIYLQSKTLKSETIRQKKQQIEQCTFFAKLSEDQQKEIKRYPPHIWEETKGVDFEFLFNLPDQELRKKMKRKLCLELLRKVDRFVDIFGIRNAQWLEELCDCVKPVSYAQHTEIVQKGSSIDQMLFLVQGTLQTYSLTGVTANSPPFKISIESLKEGEFCGEELVERYQPDLCDLDPSNLPISNRTIQTITKVDAFALMYYDLQNVFIKHRTQVQALPPADSQPQAPPPPAEPPVQQPASGI